MRVLIRALPATVHVLRAVTRLAALCHDLGKTTLSFVSRVVRQDGRRFDPVRHEVISALLFFLAICEASKQTDKGKISLDEVSDDLILQEDAAERIIQSFDKIVRPDGTVAVSPGLENRLANLLAGDILSFNGWSRNFAGHLIYSTLWLIASHHRLPGRFVGKTVSAEEPDLILENLIALPAEAAKCLRLDPASLDDLPWRHEPWRRSLAATLDELRNAVETCKKADESPWTSPLWFDALAHVARPVLTMADHDVSSETDALEPGEPVPGIFYANTCRNGGVAQRLVDHLVGVKKRIGRYFALMLQGAFKGPGLIMTEVAQDTPWISTEITNARYQWQIAVDEALAGVEHDGFFGVVLATTGAGKTIFGMRVMRILGGDELRVTYAHSMRTLAVQTSRKLLSSLRLARDQLVTIIGGEVQNILPDEADITIGDADQAGDKAPGPGDRLSSQKILETYEEDVPVIVGAPSSCDTGVPISVAGGPVGNAILAAPVLSATVDHVVHAAELLRGGAIRPFLRSATSDLILDEIDGYGPEDLVSLGKLVYLQGVFRRRVLLMSATIMPDIAEELWRAYRRGLAVWDCLFGGKTTVTAGFFSDLTDGPKVLADPDDAGFDRGYADFVDEHIARHPKTAGVRLVRMPDAPGGGLKDAFRAIYGECQELHRRRALVDPATGARLSIGFVRLNTVRHCREFADYLRGLARQDQGDGFDLRTQCYHSDMFGHYRLRLELCLDRILNRHDPEAIWMHPEVRKLLDANPDRSDKLVIVVTTSIQETGRDHDYDWCVLEPAGGRSTYQSFGRVRRHRPTLSFLECGSILDRPLQAYAEPPDGLGRIWGPPGIESAGPRLRARPSVPVAAALRRAGIAVEAGEATNAALPSIRSTLEAYWNVFDPVGGEARAVGPRGCLRRPELYSDAPHSALEHLAVYRSLRDRAGASLERYLGSAVEKLCWTNARTTRFRKGAYATDIDVTLDGNSITVSGRSGGKQIQLDLRADFLADSHWRGAFLDLREAEHGLGLDEKQMQALRRATVTRYGEIDSDIVVRQIGEGGNLSLDVDPFLGLRIEQVK